MKAGIFKTSLKENEKRLPIHPDHIKDLPSNILINLYFETGYGQDFGYSDNDLIDLGCNMCSRDNLFYNCDILILPKPVIQDLEKMKVNQTLCGWTHAVQQTDIATAAIGKKLTLIAWEEMNHVKNGEKLHIFYKNNELAGYAGVLHYLQLCGQDGLYGENKKVVVLGFGSVSRGAIYALQNRGYTNITVYTQRESHLIHDKIPGLKYKNLKQNYWEDLENAGIIFNGVLQDVLNPLMFIENESHISKIKSGTGIIDISCDKGMGFYFAEPTTFIDPIIYLDRGIKYYSVDHTPTYLWDAATREISNALLPYIYNIINPDTWNESEVIRKAIDIQEGKVLNENIKRFRQKLGL